MLQLEKTVEGNPKSKVLEEPRDKYTTFAEQYLEKPTYIPKEIRAGFTVTVCTWKGIPTVDDW